MKIKKKQQIHVRKMSQFENKCNVMNNNIHKRSLSFGKNCKKNNIAYDMCISEPHSIIRNNKKNQNVIQQPIQTISQELKNYYSKDILSKKFNNTLIKQKVSKQKNRKSNKQKRKQKSKDKQFYKKQKYGIKQNKLILQNKLKNNNKQQNQKNKERNYQQKSINKSKQKDKQKSNSNQKNKEIIKQRSMSKNRSKQKQKWSIDKNEMKYNTIQKNQRNNQNIKSKQLSKQKKSNNKKIQWNQEKIPYNSKYVLQNFINYLNSIQQKEIKQFKQIYYINRKKQYGKIIRQQQYHSNETSNNNNNNKPQLLVNDNNCFSEIKTMQNQQKIGQMKIIQQYYSNFYEYQIGDHIAYRYQIINSISRGSFGQVIRAYDHKNNEMVAIKIIKHAEQLIQQTLIEISILTHIKQKDRTNTSGIVRIKDFTIFRNHFCIIFELLQGNLYQLMICNNFQQFTQQVISIFAIQILNSLNFLQHEQIIHCDLKPQNIVMKKWGKTGIKLIDFGTSCFNQKQIYFYIQSRFYRAPEIILEINYTYSIDMWSFGCLIAQLKIGQPLFPGQNDSQQLIYMICMLGWPKKISSEFSNAFYSDQYVMEIQRQKYIEQFQNNNNNYEKQQYNNNLLKSKIKQNCTKCLKDRLGLTTIDNNFYDLISSIICWQPQQRIKPIQALKHPWILHNLPNQLPQLSQIFDCTGTSTSQSYVKKKNHNKII